MSQLKHWRALSKTASVQKVSLTSKATIAIAIPADQTNVLAIMSVDARNGLTPAATDAIAAIWVPIKAGAAIAMP